MLHSGARGSAILHSRAKGPSAESARCTSRQWPEQGFRLTDTRRVVGVGELFAVGGSHAVGLGVTVVASATGQTVVVPARDEAKGSNAAGGVKLLAIVPGGTPGRQAQAVKLSVWLC